MPYLEYLHGILGVIVPFIEEHVTQTGAYYGACHGPQQEYAQPFLGGTFMAVDPRFYFVSYQEAEGEHQPVPPHLNEGVDEEWIGVPDYMVKHNSNSFRGTDKKFAPGIFRAQI